MKLRLRSLESKQTLKIEVPNSCNLQQLKQLIILQLFPSSSSSSSSHNLLLSLNRKDELFGFSPEQSLQSIGVTSGDLIYYSQNPYAFSSQNPNFRNLGVQLGDDQGVNLMSTQVLECGKIAEIDVSSDTQINKVNHFDNNNDNSNNSGVLNEFSGVSDENRVLMVTQVEEVSKSSNSGDFAANLVDAPMMECEKVNEGDDSNAGSRELSNTDDKESDDQSFMEVDDGCRSNVNTRFSISGFLKNVYSKEVGDAAAGNGGNHKLLVIAVHAVLLESGFVGYDPVSGMKLDGFHLPDEWPSSAFGLSLHYTLPQICSREVVETVVVKFQTLGKYVNVYGVLPKSGYEHHRVCLDEPRFIPALSYVCKKSDDHTDLSMFYVSQEIFEFWKVVKDGISYPLLIELCEHVGLGPPPCLMRLPTELKLKILEALPADDIAKVSCVSSELNFVASNNDLWKLKYEEEFGNGVSSQSDSRWKGKFSSSWVVRRKRKSVCVPLRWREPPHSRPFFPGRRNPNPFRPGYPLFWGGDYDAMPGYGLPGHRFFGRNCDLGKFGV